jgi:hypothetical protein
VSCDGYSPAHFLFTAKLCYDIRVMTTESK